MGREEVHDIFGDEVGQEMDIDYNKPFQDYLVKCTMTNLTYNFLTPSESPISSPEENHYVACPFTQLLSTDARIKSKR